MKKSSGDIRYVYSDPIERFSPNAPAPPAPTMPPSPKPGAQSKDDIYAPEPITSNSEVSGDVTGNNYAQDLGQLLGGASDAPKPNDVVHPTSDELAAGPGVGIPRPDIH